LALPAARVFPEVALLVALPLLGRAVAVACPPLLDEGEADPDRGTACSPLCDAPLLSLPALLLAPRCWGSAAEAA
jgi:hypothetical protein